MIVTKFMNARSSPIDRVLGLLDGVKGSGKQFYARCPAHDDKNPSLSVSTGDDGRVLLHCHAGCDLGEILSALDLTAVDLRPGLRDDRLTVEELARDKALPLRFLKRLRIEQQNGHVRIPYRLTDDSNAPRCRIRTARNANEGSSWSGVRADGPIVPYGLERLNDARKIGFLVIVEGESDCWTLWYHKQPALGIPGADMTDTLEASYLEGIKRVFLLHEPDNGGDIFIARIVDRLRRIGFEGEVFEVNLVDAKDPNDLHKQDLAKFKAVFKSALDSANRLDLLAWPELDDSQDSDVLSFPVDVFPANLRAFVGEVSKSMGCPADFVAVPMLIVAGAAIGNSRALQLKPGWIERPILYGGCAGSPGTTKSPALSAATTPITNAQARLKAEWDHAVEKWKEVPSDARAEKPKLHRVLCNDTTVEAIASVLACNHRGLLLCRDELIAWVRSMDQYKVRGSDRQFWLSSWSCQPIVVDRKSLSEPLAIEHPFISVVGSLTPDMLSELADSRGRCDGSLERLLIVLPNTTPVEKWSDDGVSDESAQNWQTVVDALLKLEMEGLGPRVLKLTLEAKREWEKGYNTLSQETDEPALLPSLKGTWSKMKNHLARFALIVHLLRRSTCEVSGESVDDESVRRAVKLADYFKSHAVRVHRRLAGRFGTLTEDAQAILDWARKHQFREFSEKDLYDHLRRRFGNHNTMHKALYDLTESSWLRPISVTTKGRGRKASSRYEVHPGVFSKA